MEKLNGVKITRKLIREGMPDNSEACPIARAITRRVGMPTRVNKSMTMIVQEGEGESIWIKHTPELTDWINQFDQNGSGWGAPEPIILELSAGGYLGIKEGW